MCECMDDVINLVVFGVGERRWSGMVYTVCWDEGICLFIHRGEDGAGYNKQDQVDSRK